MAHTLTLLQVSGAVGGKGVRLRVSPVASGGQDRACCPVSAIQGQAPRGRLWREGGVAHSCGAEAALLEEPLCRWAGCLLWPEGALAWSFFKDGPLLAEDAVAKRMLI